MLNTRSNVNATINGETKTLTEWADSQSIIISCPTDSTLQYQTIDGNQIKRVEKRKLVKIPESLIFKRIK